MKTKIYLLLFVLIISVPAYAQLEQFKLQQYTLPELKRQFLNVGCNINGNGMNFNNENRNNVNIPIFLEYEYFRNTKRFQNELNINNNFNYSFLKETNSNGFVSNNSNTNNVLKLSSTNRFYGQTKQFIGFQANLNNEFNDRKNETDSSNTTKNDNDIKISASFILGLGRIEQIEDARLAVYILTELKRNNKLLIEPTDADVIEFSQLISTLKNERLFDSRIKKLYELEKVDAFFKQKAWVKDADIRYYNTINDNWEFGAGPKRASGKRLTLGLGTIWENLNFEESYSNHITENVDRTNKEWAYFLDANYVIEKPQNLYFQHSLIINLQFQKATLRSEGQNVSTNDESTPSVNSSVSYTFAYYPNTRTDISWTIQTNYIHTFAEIESVKTKYKQQVSHIIPATSIHLNYYFSSQLRFYVSARLDYRLVEANSQFTNPISEDKYGLNKGFNHSFRIGFTYSLF